MGIPQPQTRYDSSSTSGGPPLRRISLWSATQWIIAINVAVLVFDMFSGGLALEWGRFSATAALWHLQLWRFITCMFVHDGPFHLLFNLLALWYVRQVV